MKDDSRDLPTSSAPTAGAGAGSKAGASTADLKRGYSDAHTPEDPFAGLGHAFDAPKGVAGRPRGWER